MSRILLILLIVTPSLALAYTHDEYMQVAPRPTIKPKPIQAYMHNTPDTPISDIKPYELTYDD